MRALFSAAVAAAAVVALSSAPGYAASGSCVLTPAYTGSESGADQACSYTAGAPGQFVAATPNDWSIVVTRGTQVVWQRGGSELPSQGTIPSIAGDKVEVLWRNACAVEPACGQAGLLYAGDL